MSWNEPSGDKKDKKDPWSDRGDQSGPPDLDEAIRSLQEKLGRFFGGGGGGRQSTGGSFKTYVFLLAGLLVLWLLSGFYIVDEGTNGVVTRFGKYTETTQPGLNWRFPKPIESHELVNVQQQRFIEIGYRTGASTDRTAAGSGSVPREALMLTRDENIVDVRLAVQYRIGDAKQYLFNVRDPLATLKQATESVERGVIGRNDMNFVLLEGRVEIVGDIAKELQQILDSYEAGILITDVNLQDAQPPEPVQAAFEDAIKAREDKERYINEAEAYRNDVVPKARGAASRRVQAAEAYKERVIARAEGEASRFSNVLAEYKKAPDITRKRLYIETLESVMSQSSTVMVDVKGGNNLLYLPLDKITGRHSKNAGSSKSLPLTKLPIDQPSVDTSPVRTSTRGRDVRGR
ncbi:MAG: FtsH protease activity modulator HflK [Gammaproteobacteria bacterium]